jgi:hypothetical protein
MTYTINDTMLGNINSTSLSTTHTIGNSNGLYWGVNGTTIASGQAGQVLTTNGTTGAAWANISADPNLQGQTLSVKGNADFDGEVTIKGKSLTGMFEKIEERLAILHPNEELEEKWDNLRALRNAYTELEAEIKEKEAMWKILKK